MLLIEGLDGSTRVSNEVTLDSTLSDVYNYVHSAFGVSIEQQKLMLNNALITSDNISAKLSSFITKSHIFNTLSVSSRLLGGKGGFGANLKSGKTKVGQKTNTDMSASRDLSGRRLRHVQQEEQLRIWMEQEHTMNPRDMNATYARINRGDLDIDAKECKYGLKCNKRTTTCKRTHPIDPDEVAMDQRRSQLKDLGSHFTHDTGGHEVDSVGGRTAEDIAGALMEGLAKALQKTAEEFKEVAHGSSSSSTSSSSSSSSASSTSAPSQITTVKQAKNGMFDLGFDFSDDEDEEDKDDKE